MTVTWEPTHTQPGITLSGGNLVATQSAGSGGNAGKTIGSNFSASGGYFEITVNTVFTSGSPTGATAIGLCVITSPLSFGFDASDGVGWYANGWIFGPGLTTNIGTTFTSGDIIGVKYGGSDIKFYKGATLVYTYSGSMPSGDLYPAAYLPFGDQVTANFGASSFANTPTGAVAWDSVGGGGSLSARNITYSKTLPGLLQLASVLSGSPEPPPPTFGTGGYFPDTIAEILAGRTVRCDLLVFFDFLTTPMRLWQGFGTLVTNDANEWSGIGQLGQIGDLESSIGGTSPRAEFTLSGVDPDIVADALAAEDEINNRDVNVYIQFFNNDYTCLDNPYVVWAGIMDNMRIRQAGPDTCTVELSAETIFSRRSLPPLGILSDREHQQFYPGDTGLAGIPSLMSKVAIWPVILPGFP